MEKQNFPASLKAPHDSLNQGFSKGVPRNFWTVPREKVLGKCEHIKKGLCIKYLSSVTY